MTSWEVYIVMSASPHHHVVVEVERLHSTWDTFEDAMRMAGDMFGHNVRVRERAEDSNDEPGCTCPSWMTDTDRTNGKQWEHVCDYCKRTAL